jgi:ERCC4-type nuclease
VQIKRKTDSYKDGFSIIVDTREQNPYIFKKASTKTLKSGDYSLVGLENNVVVERKTKPDIYGSLGRGRDRFEREFKRLSKYDYAAIVIESDLKNLLVPPAFSQMNPKSVINSLISWSIKYGVFVYFASDRKHARSLTYRILEKYWKAHCDRESKRSLETL